MALSSMAGNRQPPAISSRWRSSPDGQLVSTQRLRVLRDERGNATAYIQEPIDVDFEREVSELHRRARGSNGISG
jgi:hypothetical protein